MLRVIEKPSEENQDLRTTLDELLRQGALKMLQQALETEVEEYVTRHRATRDEQGRAQVVRNGKAPARQLVTDGRIGYLERGKGGRSRDLAPADTRATRASGVATDSADTAGAAESCR